MHIFIQVLSRKLDVPRGTVILMENQVVTRRMHRRLVISETGYFISTIFRCILALIIISTMDQLHYIHIGKLIIFCGPSIMFFVIPMILTLFSSKVRSSISQCLKYFRQEIRWRILRDIPSSIRKLFGALNNGFCHGLLGTMPLVKRVPEIFTVSHQVVSQVL